MPVELPPVPLLVPIPVLGEVGVLAGLGGVGLVVVGPVKPPLVAPEAAEPARLSCRHLSRSAPVRPTHLLGTVVEAPVAAVPVEGLDIEPLVPPTDAPPTLEPDVPLAPVEPMEPAEEPEDCAIVTDESARSAAAVAAARVFTIMFASPRKIGRVSKAARREHARPMPIATPTFGPIECRELGTLLAACFAFIKQGEHSMERMEKSIEVACPVRTVYNQWTQFEEWPRFMAGVKEVKQLDDTHTHFHAEVWGKDKEWDAEITEQVPDQVISWRSVSGAPNAGSVRFEPVSHDRTLVRLIMEYEPEGAMEKVGDAVGVFGARMQNTMEDFKKFIENRGAETGAWRGEVHGGQKQPSGGQQSGGRSSSGGNRTNR